MNSNKTNTSDLEDFKVNVKIKLSALWVTVMLLYIYGDIFELFVPGHIESLNSGKMGLGATTSLKLLFAAILMTIPALMVFLSITLKPKINRWLNILLGAVYTFIIMLTTISAFDSWYAFYIFLGIIEIVTTLLIVRYAWKWTKQ